MPGRCSITEIFPSLEMLFLMSENICLCVTSGNKSGLLLSKYFGLVFSSSVIFSQKDNCPWDDFLVLRCVLFYIFYVWIKTQAFLVYRNETVKGIAFLFLTKSKNVLAKLQLPWFSNLCWPINGYRWASFTG